MTSSSWRREGSLLASPWLLATPWHWHVHGLTPPCERRAPDRAWASQLADFVRAVRSDGSALYEHSTSVLMTLLGERRGAPVAVHRAELGPGTSGRASSFEAACAALQAPCHREFVAALEELATAPSARDGYRASFALARLLLAANHHFKVQRDPVAGRAIRSVLLASRSLPEPFDRIRATAVLLAVVGALRCEGWEQSGDSAAELFDLISANERGLCVRAADSVHDSADYVVFALSLGLIAAAALDRPDLLTHGARWLRVLDAAFERLSARSRASQGLFYVAAKSCWEAMSSRDASALAEECLTDYVAVADGTRVDDYLRCTYLAHWRCMTGTRQFPSELMPYLEAGVRRAAACDPRDQKYGSAYMVAAYTVGLMAEFPELRAPLHDSVAACIESGHCSGTAGQHLERLYHALLASAAAAT